MYYPDFYKDLEFDEIRENIKSEGFDPISFSNNPHDIYSQHSHPETKLLAFLEGSMEVVVDGKKFSCKSGDKLIIPGNVVHWAVVGSEGCRFFWSEKLI